MTDEIQRIREQLRDEPKPARSAAQVLPAAPEPTAPVAPAAEPEPAAGQAPQPPDGAAVNSLWEVRPLRALSGPARFAAALLRRLLGPTFEAQIAFNARQVQLDNELLAYLEARLAQTHAHYDRVLGLHGRHMQEIDQRHLELQEELVKHVHDLVHRIDLVLTEGEHNRVGLEAALRDVRARLKELAQQLAPRPGSSPAR